MDIEKIKTKYIGTKINEDIFSNSIEGLLLLKKGAVLDDTHIELLINHKVDINSLNLLSEASKPLSVEDAYLTLIEQVKETFSAIITKSEDGLEKMLLDYENLIELAIQDISILDIILDESLASSSIYKHSINVGIIAALIGNTLGYSAKNYHLLSQMGLFHDIGMLLINEDILHKKTKLTHSEYKEIQKHTTLGKSILFSINSLDIIISRTALLHHEKINGNGYPYNRKEKDIPFMIQIISVADIFNSMCSNPWHQKKKTYFEAINELVDEAHGNSLNPAIVIPFASYLMRKQLFNKVTLTTEQTAEIIFIHQNEPHLPLVRIKDDYLDLRKTSSIKIKGQA
ncbi:HD domain-containing phosphohydrolase [Niallia taxi]|uniref:HD-GYP domain-containing protein n=1 Tax=Niallia taxi TaxID=2499688 RepID=UPI00203BA4B2|nr:HD domain-containing phosphohydrolase [Niallia taxi]MCM3217654.1 HD domain-containing protein [Niallia taxi]MDK8640376.1 HD domain-containing protein [Niallia taxi]MED4054930.1 HD domain-containing protein [Niallia taxi]MED4121058.1 HD domain-containing protein [Niallia taxi]